MTHARLWVPLAAALLTACPAADAPDQPVPTAEVPADTTPTQAPTTTAAPTPTPPPTTAPTTGGAANWVGSWESKSCGERKYIRQITLKDDGSVVGKDLVSPCPPKVACVWSGIVDWTGKYAAEGKTLRISETKPSGGGGKIKLPTELRWDAPAGAPAEGDCVYTKR
jgi:hypothetical protein